MFTIQCPGCGKKHVLAEAAEAPFTKRCLRCTEVFQVTPESLRNGKTMAEPVTGGAVLSEGSTDSEVIVPAIPLADPEGPPGAGQEESFPSSGTPKSGRDKKNRSRARQSKQADGGGALAEDGGDQAGNTEDPDKEPLAKSTRPLWPMIAMLAAGGFVAAGVAWYLLSGGANEVKKSPPGATIAQNPEKPDSSSTTDKTSAKTEAAFKPMLSGQLLAKPALPVAVDPAFPLIKLSAARLATELANDAQAATRRYNARTLQVSGLFERVEIPRPQSAILVVPGPLFQTVQIVASSASTPLAFFAVEGAPVACDLGEVPAVQTGPWFALPKQAPITVKGVFGADLRLHRCELLPLAAPADDRYLGKELEITGLVTAFLPVKDDREYPAFMLEHDTNGHIDIECVFPKADEPELKKIQLGTWITLSAVCSGRRSFIRNQYQVRFDNCRFIYTTAPVPPMLRCEAAAVLRDYEEDLRPFLVPSPNVKPTTPAVSVAQLASEFAADSKTTAKKYSNKILSVTGSLSQKAPQMLVLESGYTHEALKVQCFFTQQNFRKLDEKKSFTIRGLCSGLINLQTLRLDNCEFADPVSPLELRTLTADHLPCNAGHTLIYDQATLVPNGGASPVVLRRVFSCAQGGIVTTWTTHVGKLPAGASLIDSGKGKDWLSSKRTRKVSVEGPVYQRRIFGGFVEIGQKLTNKDGSTDFDWQPSLKLGARTGDSWKWVHGGAQHHFTVLAFAEHKGRPSVVIQETVTKVAPPEYFEIRHVYVRDIGEVERQEAARLASRQMRVVSVMTLIEDEDLVSPGKPTSTPKTALSSTDVQPNKSPGK